MNKLKKIIYIIVSVTLVGAIIYGIKTRNCWADDTQLRDYIDNPNTEIEFTDFQTSDSFKEPQDIRTFNGLYDLADVIVRIKVNNNGKRELYSECIITEAEVIETYKGKVEEKKIDIIEPVQVVKIHDNALDSVMGYMLMEDEAEYILFLYKRAFSGYGKKNIYIPISTTLSKYKYDATTNDVIGQALLYPSMYDGEDDILYKDYKKYDILTENKNIVDFYNNNTNEIRRLLNEG